MRGVRACRAAASRFCNPSVRKRLVSVNDRSTLRKSFAALRDVISCTMTSGLAPATAFTIAALFNASAIVASAPTRRIDSALAGMRVRPTTE